MPAPDTHWVPELPIPIFQVSKDVERYILYDIDAITWLRQAHHVLGVLIGTLPQIPQQNVFLGLPLELQPEEARLLVENDVAYIVNDREWHLKGLGSMTEEQVKTYQANMKDETLAVARESEKNRQKRTKKGLEKIREKNDAAGEMVLVDDSPPNLGSDAPGESLFAETITPTDPTSKSKKEISSWAISPTTSYPPLSKAAESNDPKPPSVEPASYALFKHLHDRGYFITPGIRFGCQFSVYPGDPLRFHSHFLSMSYDWDEEIDLLDLVGGGRLGTGVKKGWLIGGLEEKAESGSPASVPREAEVGQGKEARVRTFCIEWGGM